MPDVAADLAALPGYLRTKRLLWLTVALVVAGFACGAALATGALAPEAEVAWIASYVFQSTLLPPPIIPAFLAGFAVPRGSYLAGSLVGLVCGLLYAAVLAISPPLPAFGPGDAIAVLIVSFGSGAIIGAFASWYRDFLQRSAARRRAAQLERQKQRRREERQGSRSARR